MSDEKKNIMVDIFLNLGYDEDSIMQEGFESDVMRNSPNFNRAIAEYKYDLVYKEDAITSDPSLDRTEANRYREYFSMLRLLLDGLVNTLDQKIQLLENNQPDT